MLVDFSLNLASKEHVGEIMQKQSQKLEIQYLNDDVMHYFFKHYPPYVLVIYFHACRQRKHMNGYGIILKTPTCLGWNPLGDGILEESKNQLQCLSTTEEMAISCSTTRAHSCVCSWSRSFEDYNATFYPSSPSLFTPFAITHPSHVYAKPTPTFFIFIDGCILICLLDVQEKNFQMSNMATSLHN